MTDDTQATTDRFFEARSLPVGTQLFPYAAMLRADLAGTLRDLGRVGIATVETAGLYDHPAGEFRAALDDAGLVCTSMHVHARPLSRPIQNLRDDLDAVVADAHKLGATDIVVPIFLMRDDAGQAVDGDTVGFIRRSAAVLTAENYKRTAAFLNDRAALLRAHGLRLGYHNHNFEFRDLGDGSGYDILMRETDPSLVDFELDVGWARSAGCDVFDLLDAHAGRFTQMHVKDLAPSTPRNVDMVLEPTVAGDGAVAWASVLPAAYAAGVRTFFIDQEPPFAAPWIDIAAANCRYLSRLEI